MARRLATSSCRGAPKSGAPFSTMIRFPDRRSPAIRARRAVTLRIGVVPLLLGACGGDSDKDTSPQATAFCVVVDPVRKLCGVLESEDPAEVKAKFVAAETALAAVAGDPPKDIAADIATIKAQFTAANDAM